MFNARWHSYNSNSDAREGMREMNASDGGPGKAMLKFCENI